MVVKEAVENQKCTKNQNFYVVCLKKEGALPGTFCKNGVSRGLFGVCYVRLVVILLFIFSYTVHSSKKYGRNFLRLWASILYGLVPQYYMPGRTGGGLNHRT